MKNVKRALSLVIVLALALSMCVMGAGAVKYSDVASTYAYSAEVQFLSDLEIITGYPDGTFQPEGTITRAEAAAVIFRTLAGKESSSENYKGTTDFVDVGPEHWACGYINFAVEMGIITGYPDGTFLPEKQISYAEYVTMLARALGLDIGKDLSYPYGYIAEATVENVNYGVDLAAAEPCSRGAVAKLTYNAILDATYRRIANNIYVTEKPTIAKNVLKLELMEGIVTSIDNYDWAGDNAVGEGYIRVTDADFADSNFDPDNDCEIWEYDLDVSYLGKEVKVWYKPDAVTASGDKIYAVIEQKNTSAALPHIVLKGSLADDDDNEITYALNDVDYIAKLDDNCVFVENNEYIGDMNDLFGAQMTAKEFYPAGVRAWLPIMYKFIDNDADGKYEFVVRTVYNFAEVTSITSSKLNLEGLSSIDRKNDNGKAYDWNVGLEDVNEEDWVAYYCDGAITTPGGTTSMVTLAQGPDFDSDLYEDTSYATFQKMTFATLAVEDIIDHDKFVFDGATFRTWTTAAALSGYLGIENTVADLDDAEIDDEFDLWYTASFGGIIASAEAVDAATGNFLVITDIDTTGFGGDVDVKAVLADAEEDVYTVDTDDEEGLTYYDKYSEKVSEDALVEANLVAGVLYEYDMNKDGEITELDAYDFYASNPAEIDVDQDHDKYFKKSSGKLITDAGNFILTDDSLVYVLEYDNGGDFTGDAEVYVGSFPKIDIEYASGDGVYVMGVKEKEVSGTYEVEAMFVAVISDDIGLSSVSETEDIAGYLRAVKRTGNSEEGYYYEYTIAYGDDAAATLRSRVGDDTDDLEDIVDDDDIIDNAMWTSDMGKTAQVILFDIAADGTICDMRVQDVANASGVTGSTDGNDYYSSFMATSVSTSKNRITVVAVETAATGSAKIAYGYDDADVIAEAVAADEDIFAVADDCTVFVFDMDSTNQAKVEIEALGAISKLDNDEGSLFSFAYDAEEEEITAIFVNGTLIEA